MGFISSISRIFLLVSFFSFISKAAICLPYEIQQLPFQTDTTASQESERSDITFLMGLSQIIIKDQNRLRKLKRDSTELEPTFNRTAIQFNRVDILLDSLKKTDSAGIERAVVEQEWKKLEDGLEYMLKRRRSIHQQLKIVQRKIIKEQEAFSLAMKGSSAIVMELTEQTSLNNSMDSVRLDSAFIADSTLFNDKININEISSEYNWQIVEAERKLGVLKAEFEVAKRTWFLVEQLSSINQDDYSISYSLLESSKYQIEHWKKSIQNLEKRLSELQDSDSTLRLKNAITSRIEQVNSFISRVQTTMEEDSAQVAYIQERINNLNEFKAPLTDQVANATEKITEQARWLDYLKSPLAPQRIRSFFFNSGPRILIILGLLFVFWWGAKWLIQQILKGLSLSRLKSKEDREERIITLNRAIRSGLSVLIVFVGGIAILSELGIDVSVLLGGAAVFSLAIAFGAQALIKDFFTGFMILTENQYRVGNVIKINQVSGVVEDISLRTTVLRDLEGVAHFIPHGEITTVSNLTHQWSRVALDIGVAYKENVDQVMRVIMEVADQLRTDPDFKRLITDDPEMLGVDSLADSAVVIKVLLKTKPMKQWLVKREFLRRIKNRFDALGIEIPFPHRTVYHRDLHLGASDQISDADSHDSNNSNK